MSRTHDKLESPTAPAAIRLLLLGLLPLIAALLYLDGQNYDADLLDFSSPGKDTPVTTPFPERILGLNPTGQTRHFDKENLYEYINGHAEYFIGAGFQGLAVEEYGGDAKSGPQVVINAYDMDSALNAFGVLVQEAGQQQPLDIGALGFHGDQGVSFMHGPYYIQITLFDKALDATDAARDVAARLAETIPAGELSFSFPDLGRVLSTRYEREYYRGMEFFNRVLEREFEREEMSFQAFSITAAPMQIDKIVQDLLLFLDQDGIAHSEQDQGGLTLHRVQDPYEGDWFFVPMNGVFIGVYTPFDEAFLPALTAFSAKAGK